MRRLGAALAACFVSTATAQPFVEAGVGAVTGGCLYRYRTDARPSADPVQCSQTPVTVFAAGWQWHDRHDGEWRIQFEHWSAPMDARDRGVEFLTIRYRWVWR